MELDRLACDRARRSRDARFDGRFFIAVTTTRIYCRPICPAPSPKDEHVLYFATAAAAEAAGFRPCRRCRPEVAPGTPAWLGTSGIVTRALRLIGEGALDGAGVEQLAGRLGVTGRHMRRLFLRHVGTTPLKVARAFRSPDGVRVRLPYRPPYDWEAVLTFLQARATPGVESTDRSRYRRTISLDGHSGTIEVSRLESGPAFSLDVRFPDARALLVIVERVKRMFDLGANPIVIAEHLGSDPLLRRSLAKHPGMRTPGSWDTFELAVRAILGQQISVRAATTIAGRIASRFGSPVSAGGGLDRLFPTPAQLANAPLEQAGVMPARAATIRALARRAARGTLDFSALESIPGIGDWTAQYIAMRALGEPDAFPSGDLVLRRAAGPCTARELDRKSAAWRPWRAYAAMLLWRTEAQPVDGSNPHDRDARAAHVVAAHGAR